MYCLFKLTGAIWKRVCGVFLFVCLFAVRFLHLIFFNLINTVYKEAEGSLGLAAGPTSVARSHPRAGGPADKAWLHWCPPPCPGQAGRLSLGAQGPGTPSHREAGTI